VGEVSGAKEKGGSSMSGPGGHRTRTIPLLLLLGNYGFPAGVLEAFRGFLLGRPPEKKKVLYRSSNYCPCNPPAQVIVDPEYPAKRGWSGSQSKPWRRPFDLFSIKTEARGGENYVSGEGMISRKKEI